MTRSGRPSVTGQSVQPTLSVTSGTTADTIETIDMAADLESPVNISGDSLSADKQ